MAEKEEANRFLKEFKQKLAIWDVVFLNNRNKNIQALADLDINPAKRIEVLNNLTVDDFSEGPFEELIFGGSEMWVFGKQINGIEVYIKISMGRPNKATLCISFHLSEYKMNYPYKY